MFKCTLCDKEYDDIIPFCKHWGRIHRCSSESLYKIINKMSPKDTHLCECGCGAPTLYLDVVNGYRKYIRGHAARINNNWGHNQTARQNSLNKRLEMLEKGTWKPFRLNETGEPWNKGLTAQTDSRIAQMIDAIKSNPGEIKRRSDVLKNAWADGRITVKYGPEHSQWKGGVSTLSNAVGSNINLYKLWKYPKLCTAGFKCQGCTNGKGLEVHHDVELWSDIIKKVALQFNWFELTKDVNFVDNSEVQALKMQISNAVVDYHVNNNVSGRVLCKACHKLEHASYNFIDDDIEK